MIWRQAIAVAANLPPLGFMEGFFAKGKYDDPLVPFSTNHPDLAKFFYDCLPIKWNSLKPDPLHELLNHSDCDGTIPWQNCSAIADRLEQILPLFPTPTERWDFQNATRKFIDGLRLAESLKEDVDFH